MSEQEPHKKRRLLLEQNDDSNELEKQHLEWTSIQGHILSGGGRAEALFTPERGFDFSPEDLPHFHLLKGDTHAVFGQWKNSKEPASIVTGAWNRPLFVGGWHHSTNDHERVYNLQSHNMFIDLRIPRTRELLLNKNDTEDINSNAMTINATSLDDLTPQQLRIYARQHVFAGFSVPSIEHEKPLCTRHHCIDWNFVGQGRPRPNKWWIDIREDQNQWKESSYATDENGQYYYFERWERYPNASRDAPRVALRKSSTEDRDGVFVMVGDHFNYILARTLKGSECMFEQTSLVNLVDAAVKANDLESAKAYLSIEAGHGTLSSGWKLDCAIPFWNEGNILPFIDRKATTKVAVANGNSTAIDKIVWGGHSWDVMDSSFSTIDQLVSFLSSPSN